MSWVAWILKDSSTLVYGAKTRWIKIVAGINAVNAWSVRHFDQLLGAKHLIEVVTLTCPALHHDAVYPFQDESCTGDGEAVSVLARLFQPYEHVLRNSAISGAVRQRY